MWSAGFKTKPNGKQPDSRWQRSGHSLARSNKQKAAQWLPGWLHCWRPLYLLSFALNYQQRHKWLRSRPCPDRSSRLHSLATEPDAHVTATYAAEMHSRIHSRPQGWLKRWLLYWTEEWTRFSKKRRCKSTGLSKCKRNRTDVQLASQLPLAIQKAEHLAAKITTQRVTE